MPEAIQETHQEFWRPPSPVVTEEIAFRQPTSTMAEVCPQCKTEFLLGSGFCHSCGVRRPATIGSISLVDSSGLEGFWEQGASRFHSLHSAVMDRWSQAKLPAWLSYFHFHEIKRRIGLSTASLIAFVIGLVCVAGALMVGMLTARNFVDWQAIQFYRGEWLLAAIASFVAGILLKKSGNSDGN
jgi:hypothetical protein